MEPWRAEAGGSQGECRVHPDRKRCTRHGRRSMVGGLPVLRRVGTAAGSNRRIRKTVRPVVWEGAGAQSPVPDPINGGRWSCGADAYVCRIDTLVDARSGLPNGGSSSLLDEVSDAAWLAAFWQGLARFCDRPNWGRAGGRVSVSQTRGSQQCCLRWGDPRYERSALGERATLNLSWPGNGRVGPVIRPHRSFQSQASTRGARFRGGWRGKWLKGTGIRFWKICDSGNRRLSGTAGGRCLSPPS